MEETFQYMHVPEFIRLCWLIQFLQLILHIWQTNWALGWMHKQHSLPWAGVSPMKNRIGNNTVNNLPAASNQGKQKFIPVASC